MEGIDMTKQKKENNMGKDTVDKVKLFKQLKEDLKSENDSIRKAAKNRLYDELIGFVGKIINEHFSTYKSEYYEEMIHEAWIGIMENIEDYDPEYSKPTTWAYYPIVHQVSIFVNTISNNTSTHHSLRMKEVKNCIEAFKKRGQTPTVSEISNYTGISVRCVEEEMSRINFTMTSSLESCPIENPSFSDIGQNPEAIYVKNDLIERLYKAIDELLPMERNVIKYHFGLIDDESMSATKIAKKIGATRLEVQTALSRALKKLESSPYLSGESGSKWNAEKDAHVGKIAFNSLTDEDAEECYSELRPEGNVILVVADDSDDRPSLLGSSTTIDEEDDGCIHLVF